MYFPFLKVDPESLDGLFHIHRQDGLRVSQIGHGAKALGVLVGIQLIPCFEVDQMDLLVLGGREKEVWAEEADGFWGKLVLGVSPQRLCSG